MRLKEETTRARGVKLVEFKFPPSMARFCEDAEFVRELERLMFKAHEELYSDVSHSHGDMINVLKRQRDLAYDRRSLGIASMLSYQEQVDSGCGLTIRMIQCHVGQLDDAITRLDTLIQRLSDAVLIQRLSNAAQ